MAGAAIQWKLWRPSLGFQGVESFHCSCPAPFCTASHRSIRIEGNDLSSHKNGTVSVNRSNLTLLRTSHDKRAPSLPLRALPPGLFHRHFRLRAYCILLTPGLSRIGFCDERKPPCHPAYDGVMIASLCPLVAYSREQIHGWPFRMVETEISSCIEETPELGSS